MSISPQEARKALDAIEQADAGVARVRTYAYGSPFLILWGVVWAAANVVTDVRPHWGGRAWLVGSLLGWVVTVLLTVRISRHESRRGGTRVDHDALKWRYIILGTTVMSYFVSMFLVLGPLTGRQTNAFISLSWALIYMASGAWVGARLTIIGAVTAAAIVVGYLFVQQHFDLWMAVFGGGSLIVAGLWLRKL